MLKIYTVSAGWRSCTTGCQSHIQHAHQDTTCACTSHVWTFTVLLSNMLHNAASPPSEAFVLQPIWRPCLVTMATETTTKLYSNRDNSPTCIDCRWFHDDTTRTCLVINLKEQASHCGLLVVLATRTPTSPTNYTVEMAVHSTDSLLMGRGPRGQHKEKQVLMKSIKA